MRTWLSIMSLGNIKGWKKTVNDLQHHTHEILKQSDLQTSRNK